VRRCGSAGRPCRWPTLALLATLLLLAQAAGVRAQIPYLDPIPWVKTTAKIGQEAVLFNLDRFWDTRTDWTANRLGVTGLLRAGRSGMFYFRVWYVAFDSGDLPVLERWPDVRGTDAEPDWPGEARSVGLGRPQLGAVGQFSIYGLGKWWYGLGVGLPIGRDQLYPMSAASIPVQLDVRKSLDLSAAVQLALYGGPIWHFPSSRDKLSEEAFPNGFHGAADQRISRRRRSAVGAGRTPDSHRRRRCRGLSGPNGGPSPVTLLASDRIGRRLRCGSSLGAGQYRESIDRSGRFDLLAFQPPGSGSGGPIRAAYGTEATTDRPRFLTERLDGIGRNGTSWDRCVANCDRDGLARRCSPPLRMIPCRTVSRPVRPDRFPRLAVPRGPNTPARDLMWYRAYLPVVDRPLPGCTAR